MRVLKWMLAFFALAAVACAILFPVFQHRSQDVYPWVLAMHQDPKVRPHEKAQLPFLYVSWFKQGSLKCGEDFAVYGNGEAKGRRILTYAVEGGSLPRPNQAAFQTLRRISALPPGLPSPDAVPHGRLLIVSLKRAGQWQTYYYDRQALPKSIQTISGLAGVGAR